MSTAAHAGHPGPENPDAGQGAVLLDIGGDIGALVVTMPDDLVGTEVEIEPEHEHEHGSDHGHDHGDGHHHREHVAVVSRPVLAGSVPSLVFPALREGRYRLFDKGEDVVRLEVRVTGGEVTLADWSA